MKINAIIFLAWGIILNIIFLINMNLDSLRRFPLQALLFFLLAFYPSFILAFIVNKIEGVQKTDKAKINLKIISIITNILAVSYILFVSLVCYVVFGASD